MGRIKIKPTLSSTQALKFQYLMVTKRRFCIKQVKVTYFENGFRKEKVVFRTGPSPVRQNTPEGYTFSPGQNYYQIPSRDINSTVSVYLFPDS